MQFAQGLGTDAQLQGYNWSQPLMGTGAFLDNYLQSLQPMLSGPNAYANGMPTFGTGSTALGQLLRAPQAGIGSTASLAVGAETPLSLAQQLSRLLPPEVLAHVVRSTASTAGFGGDTGPLMAFLASLGFQQGAPQNMVGAPGVQGGFQQRATGGPLDPNALTLVGEAGPELITPGGAGQQQVMPLNMLQPQQSPMGTPMLPNPNQFQAAPNQGQGTGSIQQLLMQNPEQQAFDIGKSSLMGQGGILGGGGGGQGIMAALQPLFQQNLKFGLNELTNRVPSVYNSGAAIEGANVTSRALNDYNVLAAQAMQQGQQNTLGGLGLLGQLAGSAGGGAFGRNLAAGQLSTQRDLGMGQLGLQQQQQQYNQTVNPTLQLLLAALGMATPTAYQTVVKP